jgi:hypothetical protein
MGMWESPEASHPLLGGVGVGHPGKEQLYLWKWAFGGCRFDPPRPAGTPPGSYPLGTNMSKHDRERVWAKIWGKIVSVVTDGPPMPDWIS